MIAGTAAFQAGADSSDEIAGGADRGERIVRRPGRLDEADRDVGEARAMTLDESRATVNPKDDARWRM
jgi:hypothetical protein